MTQRSVDRHVKVQYRPRSKSIFEFRRVQTLQVACQELGESNVTEGRYGVEPCVFLVPPKRARFHGMRDRKQPALKEGRCSRTLPPRLLASDGGSLIFGHVGTSIQVPA